MTRRENCEDKMDQFLKRCFYHAGQYNSEEDFAELNSKMIEKEVMRTRSFSLVCLIWASFVHAENSSNTR